MIVIGDIWRKPLAKHPLTSAKIMSRNFGTSASIVKEILIRESGSRNLLEDGLHICSTRLRKNILGYRQSSS
jgi:hypothetical protein